MPLVPFADDSATAAIGGLTIENGSDRVALYGSLDLTLDQAGLAHARALRAILDAAVRHLEAQPALPKTLPPPPTGGHVANPFG